MKLVLLKQAKKFTKTVTKKQLLIIFLLVVATFIVPYLTLPGIVLWWFYKKSKFSKRFKTIATSSVIGVIVLLVGWASVLYAKDTTPTLRVTGPEATTTIKAPQVTIKGVYSPSDRTVEINGQEIATSKGQFSTTYHLKEGENKITVQAGKWKWAYAYLIITRQLTDEEKAARITPTAAPTKQPTKTANDPTSTNKPNAVATPTSKPKPTPTPIPALSASEKIQVVTIITANTNHFKQLWSDGQMALGTTQYADANAGLDALNDPNSNASKFSHYKQTENPANDLSMNDALTQADKFYPNNVSDDALNNWRMDMIQLSSDMGVWVNDATSWQISEISTSQLDNDTQTVNKDFSTVQKDIQAIK